MFDLEIIIPAELNSDKIYRRLLDFKKWGLRNTDNLKINLYFMASMDNSVDKLSELTSGWSDNFTVNGVITPYKHVSQRIFHYYTTCMIPDRARWYGRVDEDSLTDVGRLIENLDKDFDHTRDFYIVGEINRDISYVEYHLLKSLGFSNWYQIQGHDIGNAPAHEYEASFTSNSAVAKIYNTPICMQYLNMRKEFAKEYGDHAFCLAARMVKVYPITVNYITWKPSAIKFSMYGGLCNHIHHIGRDDNPEFLNWLETTDGNENIALKEEILGKNYFASLTWEGKLDRKWISFHESGLIEINSTEPDLFNKEVFGVWGFDKNGNLSVFVTKNFQINNPVIILFKNNGQFAAPNNRLVLAESNEKEPKIVKI